MTETLADDAFWRFACEVYAQHRVREACLTLQDRSDLHVNLLLGAFWITQVRRQIEPSKAERIRKRSRDWQSIVTKPLREIRRNYEQAAASLSVGFEGGAAFGSEVEREAVLEDIRNVELASERVEINHLQWMLMTQSVSAKASTFLIWHNLEALSPWSEEDLDDIRNLVSALSES